MPRFENYTSLIPSGENLDENLSGERQDLPSTIMVPFGYAQDRMPERPKIELPYEMLREMVEELKDGNPAPVKAVVWARLSPRAIAEAVKTLVQDLEGRTHLRLALMPFEPGDKGPIVMDDHDGISAPEVRFVIVPQDFQAKFYEKSQ